MAAVPPPVVPAVVPNADIHAVLSICGIATEAHHTSIIINEGFTSLADFGLLSEKDVYEMVKQMGSRTAAAGRVYVGTLQVKKLQALCYWVRDQQKHGQALDHEDWDNEMMASTIERMRIDKERDTGAVSVSDLGKFDPEEFETSETAFVNLLSQTRGTQGESLKYVACDAVVPAVFADDAKRRMYQLPLTGGAFKEDNKQTFRLLKSYLINTPGWTWIESFNATENGCGAFLAWATHYNGQGELSKRMAMAKAKIKNLFYKNEWSLTFEKVMEILSKLFSILDKDLDERLSKCQKVEKLLSCIQTQDMEMVAQKSIIASQYPNDFRVLVTISLHRYLVCMPVLSWRTVNTRTKETSLQCKVVAVEGMAVVAEVVVILEVEVDPAVAVMAVALVDMAMVMAAALRSMVLMSQIQLALLLMRNGNSLLGTAVVSMSLRLVKG
jgi:hypothetical protein